MNDKISAKKPEKAPMKKSEKTFIMVAAAVFVVLVAALVFVSPKTKAPSSDENATQQTATETNTPTPTPNKNQPKPDEAITKTPEALAPQPAVTADTKAAEVKPDTAKPDAAPSEPPKPAVVAATAPAKASIDANAALSDRILGDTTAPVKVSEHASLNCPHCAEFDKITFDKFKKNYIDTKKAYLVFSDFPLNQTAMDAAKVARCLPHDKYFDFIHMLFATQEKWAYETNYLSYLKAKAQENGLSADIVDACLANPDLKEGMENRMKAVAAQWHINSTPSFVLNNKTVVSGAYPYEAFSKLIDEQLDKLAGKSAPAPAADTAAPTAPTKKAEDTPVAKKAATEDPSEDKGGAAAQ